MSSRRHRDGPSPRYLALRLAAWYAAAGTVWILFSDRLLSALGLPIAVERFIASAKGMGYVVATSALLYFLAHSMIKRLEAAQAAVRDKDLDIRRAYADVLSAVTGGRLVLLTDDEIAESVGTPLTQLRSVHKPADLAAARQRVKEAMTSMVGTSDIDVAICAAGEALTNAVLHAGGAEYQLFNHNGAVQLMVRDRGSGIDFKNLPNAALMHGYSTKGSLGMGFTVMLEATERLLLSTGPTGTTVVLEFR